MAAGVLEYLRTFVGVVDQLRDLGVGDYVKLPRICVVGSQSSGKSSLLEAIVGVDFLPRGEGIVTRRPIEIRLVHDSEQAEMVCIFEGEPNNRMTDFEEVRQKIEKYTNDVAGDKKGIVDEPILIQIIGSTCPDLTLIDLPGITRVPLKNSDQREDIEAITKDMVLRYAEDDRTLILAVIPANQDISTSDALQIAKKVDPKGIRTLGVVTKIDIMDRGTNAVSTLKGDEISLRLGYIGVKLRSQHDINNGVSISESKQLETDFFSSHNAYKYLSQKYWGVDILTKRLVVLLYEHIKHCLPKINSDIAEKRRVAQNRRNELGIGPPASVAECNQVLMKYVMSYAVVLSHQIKGVYDSKFQEYYDLERGAGGAEIRDILNSFLILEINSDVTAKLSDDDIALAIRRHEGDSIPGFPSRDTFEFLVSPELQSLEQPIFDCLEAVSQELEILYRKVVSRVFSKFVSLGDIVLDITDQELHDKRTSTREILDNIAQSEINYLFTNDRSYLSRHGRLLNEVTGNGSKQDDTNSPQKQSQPFYQSITDYVTSGQRTADKAAMIVDIRSRLNDYYNVVARSLRETVPKCIGHFLVRRFVNEIQPTILERVMALSGEELLNILGEPAHINSERQLLDKQLDTLNKAAAVLARELTGSKMGVDSQFDASLGSDIRATLNSDTSKKEDVKKQYDNRFQTSPPIPNRVPTPPSALWDEQQETVLQRSSDSSRAGVTQGGLKKKGLFG